MKWYRFLALWVTFLLALPLSGSSYARQASPGFASPEAVDYWLSPEMRISQPINEEPDRFIPAVAYNWNRNEYLVVWHNSWDYGSYQFTDIYARRLTASGQLLNQFIVASGYETGDGKNRYSPAVVYNPAAGAFLEGEYLVVYAYDVDGGTTKNVEVWGRRVKWDGSWKGPEFQIFSWGNREFGHPRVALNGSSYEYFVVAHAWDTTTDKFNDVAGRRVTIDGTTPYSGHNISTQDQVAQPQNPDVAYIYTNNEFLVVWAQHWSGPDKDIFAARVRGDNDQVITEFCLDSAGIEQDYPAVASDDVDRYLVAWNQIYGTWPYSLDYDVYAAEFNRFGSRQGDVFGLSTYYGADEIFPAVAINQTTKQRFVTWGYYGNNSSIMGFSWYLPSNLSWILPFPIAQGLGNSQAVAAGMANYLVVYDKYLMSDEHIYGTLYTPFVIFIPLVVR